MALTTEAKRLLNQLLRPLNARVESLTSETREARRLQGLADAGAFDEPRFPVPAAFARMDPRPLLDAVASHHQALLALRDPARNSVGFSLDNSYFGSPDAEILYAAMAIHRPAQALEVGSGNSTRLLRQAIRDLGLGTRLISVDPEPRRDVDGFVDEFIRERVEGSDPAVLASRLASGDMLLIDSSHQVHVGNDVLFLYLNVLPRLAAGVIVHIHDIFLPYEYPREFVVDHRWDWCEQYIVQALLAASDRFEVLWAGHYLQRTMPSFADHFPLLRGGRACSLILRIR